MIDSNDNSKKRKRHLIFKPFNPNPFPLTEPKEEVEDLPPVDSVSELKKKKRSPNKPLSEQPSSFFKLKGRRGLFHSLAEIDVFKAIMLGLPYFVNHPSSIPFGYVHLPIRVNGVKGGLRIIHDDKLKLIHEMMLLSQAGFSYRAIAKAVQESGADNTIKAFKTVQNILEYRYPIPEVLLPLEERIKFMRHETRSDIILIPDKDGNYRSKIDVIDETVQICKDYFSNNSK